MQNGRGESVETAIARDEDVKEALQAQVQRLEAKLGDVEKDYWRRKAGADSRKTVGEGAEGVAAANAATNAGAVGAPRAFGEGRGGGEETRASGAAERARELQREGELLAREARHIGGRDDGLPPKMSAKTIARLVRRQEREAVHTDVVHEVEEQVGRCTHVPIHGAHVGICPREFVHNVCMCVYVCVCVCGCVCVCVWHTGPARGGAAAASERQPAWRWRGGRRGSACAREI